MPEPLRTAPYPMLPPERTSGWRWVLPRVSLALFVLAIGALLWLLHARDREEQHDNLINDVLWIEQNFRFQLDRNAELLQRLGDEIASGRLDDATIDQRASTTQRLAQGISQLMWIDARHGQHRAWPPNPVQTLVGEAQPDVPSPETSRIAAGLGKPAYSTTYPIVGADIQFEVHVPIFSGERLAGTVVGLYSGRQLLSLQVPWWFAEKYKLNIVDDAGTVLVSKSNVDTGQVALQYQVPFDPPGHGLALQVVAYRSDTRLLPALLMSSVAGLGIATLWSLWALRRHVQRRYAAENALRDEHAFRQAMENSLHTGMRARDLEGRILYVNRAFCQMTGFTREEVVGRVPPMPYWPPEETERIDSARNLVLEGRAPSSGYELRYMRKNGERFDVLIHEAPLIDGEGRQIGWMGSVLDITERKRGEELARQQQEKLQFTARLVTMGEMASTLAHELNQPLAAISSYSTGALNRLDSGRPSGEDLREVLAKLQTQARRAGQIIRRVHDFVRRSEPKRDVTPLRLLLEDAIGLMEPLARRHGVRITLDLPDDLPAPAIDRLMIEQVLVNLLRNGIDAMGETPPGLRELRVRAAVRDDGVQISVADRGPGITSAVAEKLYAPFFTTKPDGMGMGLNICRSIAELHGGHISHHANPDGGTVFVLQLPLEAAGVAA